MQLHHETIVIKKIREGEKKGLLNKGSHEESNPVHQIEKMVLNHWTTGLVHKWTELQYTTYMHIVMVQLWNVPTVHRDKSS